MGCASPASRSKRRVDVSSPPVAGARAAGDIFTIPRIAAARLCVRRRMEEAVALLATEECTNAVVAAAEGTAAAVPHEPAAAAVTTMGNGGALGPVMVAAIVADRAAVATACATASVAVAVV